MSEPEYYSILGVPKGANDADIKRAYRKLAMKYHPDKNPDSREEAEQKFQEIAESYDVLSNPKTRAIYDQFGYSGLKEPAAEGGEKEGDAPKPGGGGYEFKNNGAEIFSSFFGTSNPFADFGFGESQPFTNRLKKSGPAKSEAVVSDLPCSLEELFNGCSKKLRIVRKRFSGQDGTGELVDEAKVLTVSVKPGWKKGTKITFPCEGDEAPNTIPADVVFVIAESPHASLSREGGDLVFTARVSLADALTECAVVVPTLDGRSLSLPCPEVVSPGYEKTIEGEGMPHSKRAGVRGNLVIRFKIVFPTFLEEGKKKVLREVLSGTDRAEVVEEKKE